MPDSGGAMHERGLYMSFYSFRTNMKGTGNSSFFIRQGQSYTCCNTILQDEKMDEWKLKRRIDAKREIVFTLPPNFGLAPGKSVKVDDAMEFQLKEACMISVLQRRAELYAEIMRVSGHYFYPPRVTDLTLKIFRSSPAFFLGKIGRKNLLALES